MKEVEFFTFFHLLREIRRVLSAKMASNQLKISQKFDLYSFQDRELVLFQKVVIYTIGGCMSSIT